MKELELYKSPVMFIDEADTAIKELQHTYWLGATRLRHIVNDKGEIEPWDNVKQLQGITSTLLVKALGDPYKDLDEGGKENMIKAAQRGHNVHEDIESICCLGTEPLTLEGKNFMELLTERHWTMIENEYTVSDEDTYASKIDLLFLDENGQLCIGDIKTYSEDTARQQVNRVALQCAIYNYMFSLHNEMEITRHVEVRLRGEEVQVVELPIIDNSIVEELIYATKEEREDYHYDPVPFWYYGMEYELDELYALKEKIDAEIAAHKEYIMDKMKKENYRSLKNRYITSIVKGRTTSKVNEARLKEEHPDIMIDFMVQKFDESAFKKAAKKDASLKEYITETTGQETLRVVLTNTQE